MLTSILNPVANAETIDSTFDDVNQSTNIVESETKPSDTAPSEKKEVNIPAITSTAIEYGSPIVNFTSTGGRGRGQNPVVILNFKTSSTKPILQGDTITFTLEGNESLNFNNGISYFQTVTGSNEVSDVFEINVTYNVLTLTAKKMWLLMVISHIL